MPAVALRPCPERGCPALTHGGRCAEHKRERNRRPWEIGPAHAPLRKTKARGYGGEWRKIRRAYLAEHPVCEPCWSDGSLTPADQVHHRDHDPHNNDWGNLEAVCVPCHRKLERSAIV